MTTPRVHTYHCTACSHLLLASTHNFKTLPTRRGPGLDSATIVPMPPPPKTPKPASAEDSGDEDDDAAAEAAGYTLLLALLRRDRAPKVVTREDGFEKRAIWRCGRCKVIVAYMLDESQYKGVNGKKPAKGSEGGFLYVLPGALTESGLLGEGQELLELL
ncbi:hypothetical protein BZA05DRAFT_413716 [Tricharina praecox]|uniref:uncharacterized protein n=1 Tax=Tricharina praecox TaxID=43433 RepID=UPI00221E8849|nr:uncharacterized protein BZA05DRAFT_413716 [Tricharina praecox]KAI5840909.1 hypothetical protein BZA05DRAFT_413716 [Tricharina praecox]